MTWPPTAPAPPTERTLSMPAHAHARTSPHPLIARRAQASPSPSSAGPDQPGSPSPSQRGPQPHLHPQRTARLETPDTESRTAARFGTPTQARRHSRQRRPPPAEPLPSEDWAPQTLPGRAHPVSWYCGHPRARGRSRCSGGRRQ